MPVTVGTNNDKAGYSLSQAFPGNFASLGINASGDVSRVSLVDTASYTAPANADIAAIKAKTDNPPDNPEGLTVAAIWQHVALSVTVAQECVAMFQ